MLGLDLASPFSNSDSSKKLTGMINLLHKAVVKLKCCSDPFWSTDGHPSLTNRTFDSILEKELGQKMGGELLAVTAALSEQSESNSHFFFPTSCYKV